LRISRGISALRHGFRRQFGLVLARLVGPRRFQTELLLAPIRSVLVCRINGRMGNALFLTPLIRHLHQLLPDASIDIAIAYSRSEELLGHLPGVRNVIVFPHKTDRMIRRFILALRRVRANRYDLAIDPVPESIGGRAVLTLCRARRRLGFVTSGQWAPLSHAVAPPREVMHQAAHPVFLLDQILGRPYSSEQVRLWLPLDEQERAAGRAVIECALGRTLTDADKLFGFFAHAAGFKLLSRTWWREFWDAFLQMEPTALPIECLPSPQHERTDARFPAFHVPSPRAVAAAIASMRAFVSTDTGPMHLASCTDVPTIALFRASDPLQYGPLKPNDLSIDVSHVSPSDAARLCQRVWRLGGRP
jgi:ADP-heptose:LPS heptosyltransferase